MGNGAVGRVGFWETLPKPSSRTPPTRSQPPPPPPTCPYHPTFLSPTAPATHLAVMEVAEHSVLFFVGDAQQIEITKEDNVNAESEIRFAISGVAPPGRPTMLWHMLNTAPAWRPPKCTNARAWSMTSV